MSIDYVKVLSHRYDLVRRYLSGGAYEGEARSAAEAIRTEVEFYGITFQTLEALGNYPPNPAIEKQVRKFWKEQDRHVKKEREEQENAWKFDPDVRPEGEGWFWVKSHQRTSCRGKVYTVRGHWRCRKTKPLEMQDVRYEDWQKSRSTDEPEGTTVLTIRNPELTVVASNC